MSRRDLNLQPTDPEGGTLSTQPLSHSATASQQCYEFHVLNKLLTISLWLLSELPCNGVSYRPIYTFQLTGYATESNEKNIFAVLCERLTPLTTFINWLVFLINCLYSSYKLNEERVHNCVLCYIRSASYAKSMYLFLLVLVLLFLPVTSDDDDVVDL